MPSGGTSSVMSFPVARSWPTLGDQWQVPILFPWWRMLKRELSGAVTIFSQAASAGMEPPNWWCPPNSERQSKTFIVTKNAVTRRNDRRDLIPGSGRRNVHCLPGAKAFRFDAGIGGHDRID